MSSNFLLDGFGRRISYLRLSLTDRCDLRCVYCMSARPQFSAKRDFLTPDQIELLVALLRKRGLRKLRLTGGEPLVRADFLHIAERVSCYDLDELTLTTNGNLLPSYAKPLYTLGVRRVNISLDSLRANVFAKITRGGDLSKTLKGIEAAQDNRLYVKLNVVALAGINEEEISDIILWAHDRKMDVSVIETMPMSDTGFDLTRHYLPLTRVRTRLERDFQLLPEPPQRANSANGANIQGPARYMHVVETGGRVGFISPLTHNFCSDCNRIRISATGKLYTCLGSKHFTDLAPALRGENMQALNDMLDQALAHKVLGHNFSMHGDRLQGSPQRMMAETGG